MSINMDKTNNLQYFLTDIADAIREKKGTSDLINAQNFADEIRNMPTSGGGEGSIEYFTYGEGTVQALAAYAQYFKIESTSMDFKAIMPYSVAMSELVAASNAEIIAIGINLSERMLMKQGDVVQQSTALESLQMNGVTQEQIDALPRITEEEFYNLNA